MPTVEVSHNLDLGPDLPNDIRDIALRQGETPDRVCSAITELRNMIYEKGDCQPIRMDDDYLLRFLRSRFFNVANAYKLICRYYEFRNANKDYYFNVNPLKFTELGERDVITVTPYRDQMGKRIIVYRVGRWKTSKHSIDDIFKATLVLLEMGTLEPIAQVMGGVGIFDLEGLQLNHVWQLTPSVAQKMISLMVTSMPLRTTALHIVNQGWAFDAAFQIFKPFLNDRMKERIFVHGSNMKSLHKHINPSHLPERYGGIHPDYQYQKWMDNLVKNEKIVKELRQLGYRFDTKDLHF